MHTGKYFIAVNFFFSSLSENPVKEWLLLTHRSSVEHLAGLIVSDSCRWGKALRLHRRSSYSLCSEGEGCTGNRGRKVQAFGNFAPQFFINHFDQATFFRDKLVEHVEVQDLLCHDRNPIHWRPCRKQTQYLQSILSTFGSSHRWICTIFHVQYALKTENWLTALLTGGKKVSDVFSARPWLQFYQIQIHFFVLINMNKAIKHTGQLK